MRAGLMRSGQQPIRLVCVKKRWGHHASYSGYDRLADYLDPMQVVRRAQMTSGPLKFLGKAWDYCYGSRPHVFDYGFGDRVSEEVAFWISLTRRANVLHVLYGDEQLDILLRRANFLNAKLVATFHLPSVHSKERFESLQREELRRLSGAIVVASEEVPAFAERLGPEKVMFVPHGIDVSAISVGPGNECEALRLVFVGLHMRDFEVAHYVADRCSRENIDVIFDVVLPKDRFSFFTGCSNIRRHSGIPDITLMELYKGADALFLPLTGGTANNAILESLASGTPVISTKVGGIADYVNDSCGWLLPLGDAPSAFECVRMLAANRALARVKRAGARAQAETFSWERVAAQITEGYRRILTGQPFAKEAP